MGSGLELFGLRKDGSEFPIEISLSPLQTDEGLLVSSAIRDITERRALEAKMQEANRLKSEFLANMSHELRTPLNAIIGFSELMYDGAVGPVSAEHQEFLGDILTSSRHLLKLINDVLDLAKVESGKIEFVLEEVLLHEVVAEVRDIVRGLAAERRLTLQTEVAPSLGSVWLDPGRLKQVLYNFLSNAIKFTPEGGRVTLRVRAEGADWFRVEVEDTGIGIAEADFGKLFLEFQQLDGSYNKRYQGTGLGLALTKKIVEAHGGRIEVKSARGAGSTFATILPRQLADPTKAKARPNARATRSSAPPAALSVLVREDDVANRDWLVRMLEEAKCFVQSADDIADLATRCRTQTFAAILVNPLLPEVRTGELLATLRESELNRDVPVLAISASALEGRGVSFLLQDLLFKPIRQESMLGSFKRALPENGEHPVLVIDDNPDVLKLAETALASIGYRSICVKSAAEGLVAAATVTPSLVVLDLLMPGMNGFEFITLFHQTSAALGVPIVIWTAKTLTSDEEARLRTSVAGVIHKGEAGITELVEQLRRLLRAPHVAHGREHRDS